MKAVHLVAAALALCAVPTLVGAREYPSRDVRVVVPFPPGSGTDAQARYFAKRLGEVTGQPFIVDNKPGGNGFIGATAVKQSVADGHTLFISSNSSMATNVVLFKSVPYDPISDFAPVARIARGANVLTVAAASPYGTARALIEAARKTPNKLTYAAGSAGYHITTQTFARLAGAEFLHVPYKGAGPAVADTVGGVVDFAIVDVSAAKPLIQGGKLRALLVASEKRHPDFPAVPTAEEAGVQGYVSYNWTALFAPAKTPKAVVDKLATIMTHILAEPATAALLSTTGSEAFAGGPDELRRFQLAEIERWRSAARRAGVEPE